MKRENLKKIDFYLVTDSGLSRKGTLNDVEQAVNAGCGIVQYREKCKSTKKMVVEALELKKLCQNRAIFLVNRKGFKSSFHAIGGKNKNFFYFPLGHYADINAINFFKPFIRGIF